jgi:HSP20 family protein
VEPKDVEVFIRNNILTIRGEKTQKSETREEGLYRAERRYGSFHREVPLPANVESGNIEATAHNGVLTVRLPKTEEAKPKKIEVKTE